MAGHEEKGQQGTTGGLGLGLGVDINLRLGEIRNLVDSLTSALQQTGETVGATIGGIIGQIRDFGVENFRKMSEQGGEAKETYNQLVSRLQDAAGRGEEEARNLLHSMGEKVEGAGEKMQEFSHKGEDETRH
ncbi:MAG: hypothetical protein ACLGPL_01025 [Acidobacteriota bacterium]